jgi:hypothetical protein
MVVMTSWGKALSDSEESRADPFNAEGDQETQNYNNKEVLLKTKNAAVNPCRSVT